MIENLSSSFVAECATSIFQNGCFHGKGREDCNHDMSTLIQPKQIIQAFGFLYLLEAEFLPQWQLK